MSALIDEHTRVLIVGIAGNFGRFSARDLRAYGTRVVAGVAHGKEVKEDLGVPVYACSRQACLETGADAALVYVPAPLALDAILEACEAGCRVVVYPGDGLPVRDAIDMRAAAKAHRAVLIGPNTPGIICPGRSKLGFMPSFCYRPGHMGVVSRSGSLSYEACLRLTNAGIGQSTVIGIGGDPVKGTNAAEALRLLHSDPDTHAILYLGEIGSPEEQGVARYASRPDSKPVAALIVGSTAPAGKKMGHAAAFIGSQADSYAAKVALLAAAGVQMAHNLRQLVPSAQAAMHNTRGQGGSISQDEPVPDDRRRPAERR